MTEIEKLYNEFARKFSGSDGIRTELQEEVFEWIEDTVRSAYRQGQDEARAHYYEMVTRESHEDTLQAIEELIDAEIDVVKSGNRCSPSEQEAAILSLNQVKERIKGTY